MYHFSSHRDPSSHSCTIQIVEVAKGGPNETARMLLEKHFPKQNTARASTATISPATGSSNPKKAAQIRQVQLMKMRHHAQPADPKDKGVGVPVSERIHLKVTVDGSDASERLLWVRKVYSSHLQSTSLYTDIFVSQLEPVEPSIYSRNSLACPRRRYVGPDCTVRKCA